MYYTARKKFIIDEEIVQEILELFGKSSQDQEVKDV